MKVIKITAIWCAACIVVNNIWRDIEKLYPEFETINYDFDMDEEAIKQYHIGTILPVIIFIRDGNEILRLVGEKSKKQITEDIERMGIENEKVI